MTGLAGSTVVADWIQAAATTTITGDHKGFSYTPSLSMIDESAGADSQKIYLVGVKDGSMTYNAVFQGSDSSGGTTTFSTLAEGNEGTLKWYPNGTAAGRSYFSAKAISQGVGYSYPYDNVVEVTVNWQQSGTRSEGTN